jgi:hypothetical protein
MVPKGNVVIIFSRERRGIHVLVQPFQLDEVNLGFAAGGQFA